jgi:hypothetical protein
MNQFQEPQRIRIGRGKSTDRLYDLEEKRQAAIEACAKEWAKVRGVDDGRYWIETLPQQLFDIMESYDPYIAITACEGFLKLHGRKVERNTSEETSNG